MEGTGTTPSSVSYEVPPAGGSPVMTEFVIAITAFCSLILIFSVAIVVLLMYFKRIHAKEEEEDDEEGTYIGDGESIASIQISDHGSHRSKQQRSQHHRQQTPNGHSCVPHHKKHTLSMWDTPKTYYVREMTLAEKFWQADTIRNPMHQSPDQVF